MIIADSHEFIELYRGDKDLRMGIEMLRLREDLEFHSFAPDAASPNDQDRFGIEHTADGPLPNLPDRFRLHLLPSRGVRFAAKESGGIVSWMPGFGRALRSVEPDVLFENPFSWLTPRSYQSWSASRRAGFPVVYYDPGDDIPVNAKQRALAPVERPVVNHAARIITYNEAGRRRFMDKYGYPESRIHVIPKPVDVAGLEAHSDPSTVRAQLGATPDTAMLVGYLGRLAEYKGGDALLSAARRAANDPELQDVRFAFIGGSLASERSEDAFSEQNSVVTGMVPHDDIASYLAACDVVVFPDITRPGGFPTAVAEAMAAGATMIVGIGTRTDLLPLRDGVNAMLVEPSSPDAILESLRGLLRMADRGADLGRAARAFAVAEMDYPVVASAYLAIAEEVAGTPHA